MIEHQSRDTSLCWRPLSSQSANCALSQSRPPNASLQTLCWLPGWSFQADVFLPLITALDQHAAAAGIRFDHWLMQWPTSPISRQDWLNRLINEAPNNAIWIGWSLGGVLADLVGQQLENQGALKEKKDEEKEGKKRSIQQIVTLATGQQFITPTDIAFESTHNEPENLGMSGPVFEAFRAGVRAESSDVADKTVNKTLRRFLSLCSQYAEQPKAIQRQLKNHQLSDQSTLSMTLDWLLDYQLAKPNAENIPRHHIYSEADGLNIWRHPSGIEHSVSSHCFWLPQCDQFAEQLMTSFLLESQPIETSLPASSSNPPPALRNKKLVAHQFSRAADTYDQAATVQRQANQALFDVIDRSVDSSKNPSTDPLWQGHWLDIGCGTGSAIADLLNYGVEHVTGIDIAEGMLSRARQRFAENARVQLQQSDADQLPMSNDTADGIWSSLMLQWSEQPEQTLREWYRVVRPGGHMVCATLLPGTHQEIKQAWQAVDQRPHVNAFTPLEDLVKSLEQVGWQQIRTEQQTVREEYSTLPELLRRLKSIGATNVNPGRQTGLGGKAALKQLANAYPKNTNGKLPLTYQLCLLTAQKSA